MRTRLLITTLIAVAGLAAAQAQTPSNASSPFYRPLTLATADSGAGGGGGEDEAARQTELVKKSLNPVASLVSVPLQNNWDFGIGPANAMKYTLNIQPVVPVTLTEDLNLIIRTILPVIYAESPVAGGKNHSGLGDTLQSFFLSPKDPVGGWIMGAGPALLYPTATDSALGSGKWAAGPTAVLLQQKHGWTVGILANHIWSYAGWGNQNVNSTYLQPFVGYSTKTHTTFLVNTESIYDWQGSQWTVPLNFMLSQMLKVGKQPISLQLGYRYYAAKPDDGPDWGLRFNLTFLFPK